VQLGGQPAARARPAPHPGRPRPRPAAPGAKPSTAAPLVSAPRRRAGGRGCRWSRCARSTPPGRRRRVSAARRGCGPRRHRPASGAAARGRSSTTRSARGCPAMRSGGQLPADAVDHLPVLTPPAVASPELREQRLDTGPGVVGELMPANHHPTLDRTGGRSPGQAPVCFLTSTLERGSGCVVRRRCRCRSRSPAGHGGREGLRRGSGRRSRSWVASQLGEQQAAVTRVT
jgi:hypothetical protein